MCAFAFLFLLSRLSVVEFISPFSFVFVVLASEGLASSFCVILVSGVALLNDSLSFPFFPVLRTFLVLFLVFQCCCLVFLYGGFLLGFPGGVHYFPILYDLLVLGS